MENKKDKFCCESFSKIAPYLGWYEYNCDSGTKLFMPYHKDLHPLRINYCVSCGSNIRDIEINASDLWR